MRVIYKVESYNTRRYGRPWIASIKSWNIGERPELSFGGGSWNTAELDAEPGDIVKIGQKDNRNPKYTENNFAVVQSDGTVVEIGENEARELWLEKTAAKTPERLRDEAIAHKIHVLEAIEIRREFSLRGCLLINCCDIGIATLKNGEEVYCTFGRNLDETSIHWLQKMGQPVVQNENGKFEIVIDRELFLDYKKIATGGTK